MKILKKQNKYKNKNSRKKTLKSRKSRRKQIRRQSKRKSRKIRKTKKLNKNLRKNFFYGGIITEENFKNFKDKLLNYTNCRGHIDFNKKYIKSLIQLDQLTKIEDIQDFDKSKFEEKYNIKLLEQLLYFISFSEEDKEDKKNITKFYGLIILISFINDFRKLCELPSEQILFIICSLNEDIEINFTKLDSEYNFCVEIKKIKNENLTEKKIKNLSINFFDKIKGKELYIKNYLKTLINIYDFEIYNLIKDEVSFDLPVNIINNFNELFKAINKIFSNNIDRQQLYNFFKSCVEYLKKTDELQKASNFFLKFKDVSENIIKKFDEIEKDIDKINKIYEYFSDPLKKDFFN